MQEVQNVPVISLARLEGFEKEGATLCSLLLHQQELCGVVQEINGEGLVLPFALSVGYTNGEGLLRLAR